MADFTQRERLSHDEAEGLALQLEQHGFVQIYRDLVNNTDVFLTDEGRVEVRHELDQAGTNLDRLRITVAGTACIRGGHTVRSYMDSKNTASTTNNYHDSTVVHGGVSGGVVLTGDHNTVNAGNGIDAQALASLVHGLRDVAPQLGLDRVDAEDYAAEVVALERNGLDPEQGGRIWRRIMRLAGPTLITAVATGVGQQLVELGAGLYS